MYYTYLLESTKNHEHYIGYTKDLKSRLEQHNSGLSTSTKRYKPWKLIYYEACINGNDARRREKYLKTTQGGRLLKRRIKDYLYENKQL